MTDLTSIIRGKNLSVNRLGMTGALSTALLFVLCWVASALGFVGSHAFIALFTLAPVLSVTALCIGAISSAALAALQLRSSTTPSRLGPPETAFNAGDLIW